jgi:hypothetical protein
MAKKQAKQKPLTPEELVKYVPKDDIPEIQSKIGFGLDNVFDMAIQSGAIIVGTQVDKSQEIPKAYKK